MALLLRSDIDMHGVVLSEFVVGEEFITDIGTLQSPKTISSHNPRKEETKCSLSSSSSLLYLPREGGWGNAPSRSCANGAISGPGDIKAAGQVFSLSLSLLLPLSRPFFDRP